MFLSSCLKLKSLLILIYQILKVYLTNGTHWNLKVQHVSCLHMFVSQI